MIILANTKIKAALMWMMSKGYMKRKWVYKAKYIFKCAHFDMYINLRVDAFVKMFFQYQWVFA